MSLEQRNYVRAKSYYQQNIPVHVSLNADRGFGFYNGYIIEMPTPDFFIMEDVLDGRKLIFFIELLKPIREFKPKEKEVKG